jgi:hypothetical protein
MFFFENRNQKTFMSAVADLFGELLTGTKGFLLLFFNKEGLPS